MNNQADIAKALAEAAERIRAGDFANAEAIYRQLAAAHPNDAAALNNLALVYVHTGRLAHAEAALRNAVAINPMVAEAHGNLAHLLAGQGRIDEAAKHFAVALSLKPAAKWEAQLADALQLLGQQAESIPHARRAVALAPGMALGHLALGRGLAATGQLEDAVKAYRLALQCCAHDRTASPAEVWLALGNALQAQGRLDEALSAFRQSMLHDPSAYEPHGALINAMHASDMVTAAQLTDELRSFNERFARPLAPAGRSGHVNLRDNGERPLRIAYISPDFRDHAIAYFIAPVLANHDRSRFEVFCYATGQIADDVTRGLMASVAAGWRFAAGMDDAQLAEALRSDRIDIAIDLSTHTAGNRLLALARRPAAVQVTWLGYAGSTGIDAIDYRLTDAIVDPPGLTESLHLERLYRLPRTQWCYRPPAKVPDVASLPFDRNGVVTFGSVNPMSKMTPTALDLWSAVLRESPGSRLMLKAKALADAETRSRLLAALSQRGVANERVCTSPYGDFDEYLRFFGKVDVILDTHPFAGGTNSCHALFMGAPIVTMVGATSVSRVAASVLTNAGLAELVAETSGQYTEIAAQLAADRARLRELRSGLRDRMLSSPLCDERGFVRDLEAAFGEMWSRRATNV